jgi:hypothetical protein
MSKFSSTQPCALALVALGWQSAEGKTMRPRELTHLWVWLTIALMAFGNAATTAFAQALPPKVGGKLLVQVKPKAPIGCKLVGTVKGTKLWAGDCTTSEPSGAAIETPPPLDVQAAGAVPSGPK